MKVIFFDPKKNAMKLLIENEDDLWHLSNIVTEDGGTTAKMHTVRKVKKEFSGERVESEKVSVTLSIKVEKAEYHSFSGALRLTGKVCSENEVAPIGSYHTFSVEPGTTIFIEKEEGFGSLDWERIKTSRKSQPKVLVLLIDRDEAIFATVSGEGVNWGVEIESNLPPKFEKTYEISMKEYFGNVLGALQSLAGKAEAVIVAGPGNAKENFADFAQGKIEFSMQNASSATKAALKEVLASGVSKILEQTNVAGENAVVEQLFARLGKNPDKVAYGIAEVERAAEAGAVETVLVSDALIKSSRLQGTYPRLEKTIKAVESGGGTVKIISEKHEAGGKVAGLGGVAAMLRYAFQKAD
jgi:protein pelota